MNKNLTLILIIAALGIGTYFLTTKPREATEKMEETAMTQTEEAMEESKAPEDAVFYSLSEPSKVEYVAQKRFLQREDAVVVGTTSSLTGEGWITPDGNSMSLSVEIDLSDLATDTPQRDKDVQNMFDVKTATIMFDETAVQDPILFGTPFKTNVLAVVSINGVEKAVEFAATGLVSETELNVSGTAEINMSEFGVKPPSLAGVFTVDDAVTLRFDISATAN
ncbi:YceI family protein [candidate division WWE3 bacterium]|jgi:polyisoprenoid-binding protein YceI|nr:YceI family protein [candidate division WWE3 bacterium]MBT7349287.1 YceI family protein [candidate division WWE3 bacterium]